MKIGITCYPTYGGSGIVATELGLELARRGHQIHFITYANPIRLDAANPSVHYHEVEVTSYPLFQYPPYVLALASRMADVAQTYQLDLLHVHYAIPHSIAALLAQQMLGPKRRLPFITTLHGTDITLVGTDRSYFPITKFSIEQSDGVTSISENLRAHTREFFGVERPIEVIHNFVNCDIYRPAPAPNHGENILVHLSNFRPVKRVLDCIRILAEVRRRAPARLLLAGDGPERGPAERLAIELGVAPFTDFLGKQDHIERLLPGKHVLLMPSEMESFGLAALEGMACGVVPVATRVGGVPELITHGTDGFLEEPGNFRAQADRVVELLTKPGLHQSMSAAARHTAESRFATSLIIPRYEEFYKRIYQIEHP
ncbi:MAG TPA: N-acetyl-alpha-D-glucosaminyl L-malate synthase BshA [Bryobacteraceae bacterium]|jgi:N-acetyl-alpha-D-glucosaminyl L-malate synthase BshA|nr:N-acetyl-alpha-D-glucosaminyl L-malate synthase BshA [Bryobacteraceae bacterium]